MKNAIIVIITASTAAKQKERCVRPSPPSKAVTRDMTKGERNCLRYSAAEII